MGRTFMNERVDYSDVQGLVRFGYGKMTEASYALLRIRNAAPRARGCASAPITSAVAMNPPPIDRAAGRIYRRWPGESRCCRRRSSPISPPNFSPA